MGSGYGACEDRGCGKVEVSTHTLICYIDHPSTVHSIHCRSNIEVGYSKFSPVFVLVPWQDFSTLQININIYYVITNVMHYRMDHKS